MKEKSQPVKSASAKPIKKANRKKSSDAKEIPSHMGYHGKDEEKNLNPEE